MVKAYLRYSLSQTFGVVCSSSSNIVLDPSARIVYAAALENIAVWNLKQASLVRLLTGGKGEITALASSPDGKHIAAGHSDGSIQIWDLSQGSLRVTFNGHKSAVSTLKYSSDGSTLVSGARDTDLVMWDTIADAGLYRLKGHKDGITDCFFLESRRQLVSSSKDGLVKVWDLETQSCVQTLVGHKGEVTAMHVSKDQSRLVTACMDNLLRLWIIPGTEAAAETTATEATPSVNSTDIRLLGAVPRQNSERVTTLRYDPSGSLLGCQTNDKMIQFFRVHTAEEVQKKLRRKKKRQREKLATKEEVTDGESGNAVDQPTEAESSELDASNEVSYLYTLRCGGKARSLAFGSARGTFAEKKFTFQVVVALSNNSIELHEVKYDKEGIESSRVSAVELPGHRSDIRSLAISADDTLLASTSNTSLKIWNARTGACIRSLESGYGLCSMFVPGNKQVIVGTKEGKVELHEVSSGTVLELVDAHEGAVWSVALRPDGRGMMSGGADKKVKFWDFELIKDPEYSTTAKRLSLGHTRTLELDEDVLCVRYSADSKFVAVSLLDSTVKVLYEDSLKFFLSLYGHKLPVLSMDISTDGTLLATGSADKTLKLWGLDFGDCHRSLRAHADSVTAVVFVPNTHYLFSASKDGSVKYWDADKFELVLSLNAHLSEVWCLVVSSLGDFVVSGSHDRSIRIWAQSDEQVFLEEEREKAMDEILESGLERAGDTMSIVPPKDDEDGDATRETPEADDNKVQSGKASRRGIENVKAGELLIEAVELAMAELSAQQGGKPADTDIVPVDKVASLPQLPSKNPLLLGKTPSDYVLDTLKGVRGSDLEESLLVLPFAVVASLFSFFQIWLSQGRDVELTCRCIFVLLRVHQHQIVASRPLRLCLQSVRDLARSALKRYKDMIGFNLAGLHFLQRDLESNSTKVFADIFDKILVDKAKGKKKRKRKLPQGEDAS